MENLLKYGVRQWQLVSGVSSLRDVPLFVTAIILYVFPLLCLLIEKYVAARAASEVVVNERQIFCLHAIVISTSLILPCAVIHVMNSNPFYGVLLLLWGVVVFMKCISFAHANHDLRVRKRIKRERAQKQSDDEGKKQAHDTSDDEDEDAARGDRLAYPANLSLNNVLYFICAPTLCYQVRAYRRRRNCNYLFQIF
jgi:diacylglycerol O-acyltransferase-1